MTTCYLHIGTPKTGTTSIQYFLYKERDSLLNQGYLYPLAGLFLNAPVPAMRYNHGRLVSSIRKTKNIDIWEEMQREISNFNPKSVIISSETFGTPLSFEDILLLKQYLGNYDVKILIYFRRQDTYFISFYCQFIKMGWFGNDFMQWFLTYKEYGDYYQLLEPWKENFGQENIIVKIYEKEQLGNGIVDDFCRSVGLSLNLKNNLVFLKENYNPNVKAIKIMRFLNNLFVEKMHIIGWWKLTKIYHSTILNNILLLNLISKIPSLLIDNELISNQDRINILREFEESNRKVAIEYLGRPDGQLFYSTPEGFTPTKLIG